MDLSEEPVLPGEGSVEKPFSVCTEVMAGESSGQDPAEGPEVRAGVEHQLLCTPAE